jgi:hypothetical protein
MCAKMLYKWQQKSGKGAMLNPDTYEGTRTRFETNKDWYSGQNGLLASWLQMKKPSVTMDFDSVKSALSTNGPIWTSGYKTWSGGGHGHVVVIFGVADTGVLINDPEPMNVGKEMWLTWSQIKKYVDGATEADVKFLTAA